MTGTDKVCGEKTQICQKQYTTLYTFAGKFRREAEQAVRHTVCDDTRRFVFFVLFHENSSAIDKNRVNLKIHKQHRDSAPRNREREAANDSVFVSTSEICKSNWIELTWHVCVCGCWHEWVRSSWKLRSKRHKMKFMQFSRWCNRSVSVVYLASWIDLKNVCASTSVFRYFCWNPKPYRNVRPRPHTDNARG